MHGANPFLGNLAIVLAVAAVTTVVCQRLRLPVVLGYLVAGLLVGPHVPIPLVADGEVIRTLAELGVILLLFSVGLSFRIGHVLRIGPRAGIIALIQISGVFGLAYLAARGLGWTLLEGLFAGGVAAISSTTVAARAFEQHRFATEVKEIVFGVLVAQDVVAVVLLAGLAAVATGGGPSMGLLGNAAGGLALFLVTVGVIGYLLVPRLIRAVARLQRAETLLVASIGLCFAIALLAERSGYSVALGAFVAGSLVAESGEARLVESLTRPLRDLFGAVFFVAIGMQLDPFEMAEHWPAALAMVLVVVLGDTVLVALGAFATGSRIRPALEAGITLAQVGEFSFLIAAQGAESGTIRHFLFPVAVATSAATIGLSPLLIRLAPRAASLIDARLPHRVQTFVALYATWLREMKESRRAARTASSVRRLARALAIELVVLIAIGAGAAIGVRRLAAQGTEAALPPWLGLSAVVTAAALLATPFVLGAISALRRLARVLAEQAFPPRDGLDLGTAPRRALEVFIRVVGMAALGLPFVALLQFFAPAGFLFGLLLLALAGGLYVFWRQAAQLEGHVRAGSEVILEMLAADPSNRSAEETQERVAQLLPGFGEVSVYALPADSRWADRSLAEINLRGLTGATVLAIRRPDGGVPTPSGAERLRRGDALVLSGSAEAVRAATRLLGGIGQSESA